MRNNTYHFKLGDFECIAISDGTLAYRPPVFPPPAAFLFGNTPEEQLEPLLENHNLQLEKWVAWESPYICLIINTGQHQVLLDTGADDLDPNTGQLLHNLKAEGIAPNDIDTVILTHGHPDHIGGITDSEGKLAFPSARYVMWKDEWRFWTSEQAELRLDEHGKEVLLGFARKNLPPIRDHLDLLEHETEITPGIHAVAAPGHTPGHMAVAVRSNGEQLLCISDTVLHPIHMEKPEWCALVDFDPEQVVATRRRLLSRAVSEEALVLAFHFPFPGLGRIVHKGEGWQWQPTERLVIID